MIRLAFLAVLALGGLIAFGAFFLVRGTEADIPQVQTADVEPTAAAPAPPPTPEVDRLYYLRDIAFDQGDITVVLFGGTKRIIRDQAALQAIKDKVYVNTQTTGGDAAGSFVLALMGAQPTETVVQVYRNDSLIAAVNCTNTACGSFADSPDINHENLDDFAVPFELVNDVFEDHETYLDTILAVSEDPNFMLLDRRPAEAFPSPPRTNYLIVSLPTVVVRTEDGFDQARHEQQVRDAFAPLLPDGSAVRSVTIENLGAGVLADKDNNQPVTAGGMPIPFPDARFFSVRARIDGVTDLPASVYDRLTDATLRDYDVDSAFSSFVSTRLQTDCVDCYFLKVDGPFLRDARASDWRTETYYLDYYDLRDPP